MKKIYIFGILALLLVPMVASAIFFEAREEINLRQGIINDDVYVAGGNVNSAATVNGDLVAGGGNLFLSGSTTDDLMIAGGSINIVGGVGDDVRAAGGTITLSGSVADDFVVAGGQINLISGSTVGGGVLVAGGRVVLDGDIGGTVKAIGGEVVINGNVGGDLEITAEKVTLGDRANVQGRLIYTSPREAEISQGAQVAGGVAYTQAERKGGDRAGGLASSLVVRFLIALVSALLIQWALKNIAARIVGESSQRMWRNLGLGFLFLIVVPIAIIIGMITIVGIPLSILALMIYVADLVFSWIFLPVFLGAIVWKYVKKNENIVIDWKTALVGALIVAVFGIIPIVGWLILFFSFLVILGGLIRSEKDYFMQNRG